MNKRMDKTVYTFILLFVVLAIGLLLQCIKLQDKVDSQGKYIQQMEHLMSAPHKQLK